MSAAVRFKQLSALRELADSSDATPLKTLASDEHPVFLSSLERLLTEPYLRWERRRDGYFGTYIDMVLENRLTWLIEWAEKTHSQPVLKLATKLYVHLMEGWRSGSKSMDAVSMVNVLEVMDGASWTITHGPSGMRENLLDVLISGMSYARYREWDSVLTYQRDGPDWKDEQEASLQEACEAYQNHGAEEELDQSESESEVLRANLKGSKY